MDKSVNDLFWKIVNCPWNGSCDDCSGVLSEQDGLSCRQVPEPWSGDLETASYLVLGGNPAIDSDEYRKAKGKRKKGFTEVFPSRKQDGSSWMPVFTNGNCWTVDDVYSFFRGRFNEAECPYCKKRYTTLDVDKHICNILSVDERGGWSYAPAKNSYWIFYYEYCKNINKNLNGGMVCSLELGRDIVVTDVVHCKGSAERGVVNAMGRCKEYTTDILRFFIQNKASSHTVLLFGAGYGYIRQLLSELLDVKKTENVGSYEYCRMGRCKEMQILMDECLDKGSEKSVRVYYNIPKPSGSNRACQNIKLYGEVNLRRR